MKRWQERCLAVSACVAGDWRARDSRGFSSTMHIDANGGTLTGAVVYDGDSDALTGTIDGNSVSMQSHSTSGTGTLEGDTMSGTFRQGNGYSGTWTATRL